MKKHEGLGEMHFIRQAVVRWRWMGESPPVCERTGTHFGVRARWGSGGLAEEAMERSSLSTPNTTNLRPERLADCL